MIKEYSPFIGNNKAPNFTNYFGFIPLNGTDDIAYSPTPTIEQQSGRYPG